MQLVESKGLSCYKKFLNVLEEYVMAFPLSSFSQYLDKALEQGKKIIPTDKKAADILEFILGMGSAPEALQFLTGRRFSALPSVLRPIYKDESNRVQVAYWAKGKNTSDMIKAILNCEGEKSGFWADGAGKKVTLLSE